ncbi:MAG: xanthine dehydrogenase family protein [Polyangiaceae bacterium]|nr:xanthine dehydrogenase family protein [Polyangiaceae bacterium]
MSQGPSQHLPTVGKSVPRADGTPKVIGTARYVDDLPAMPGELHGATVRSPVPRGILKSIRFDPNFDWSDITIVTAEDVPLNTVALIAEDQPVLAARHINHAYEPIVLLACADKRRVLLAKNAVSLDIEALPTVLDVHESLKNTHTVWGTDNIQKRYLITKGRADTEDSVSAIDAVLAECEVRVSGSYSSHHQEQLYIEPQGVVAWWDESGVHATGSLQCPFYVHKAFLKTFGEQPSRIHITQAVTGGGFGGKEEYPSIIALHAALLSKKSGKPVRMIYDRKEDIEATTKRHPAFCEIETGCDKDGKLRAIKMRVLMDGGAYLTLTPVVLSRGALHASGAYEWEHARIEALALATNTPPNGAFRGFGAPQTIWAIERHIDKVAAVLGMDPLELKRKNILKLGSVTATGQVLHTSVAGVECLEKARAVSEYDRRRKAYSEKQGRIARGIGAAVFMHGAGFTGSGERYLKGKAAVDLLPGGRLRIRTASTDIGQGTETVFRQIVSDAAQVPLSDVDFAVPCTTHVPDSGPTVASRTVMVVGSIVEAAAREVGDRVRKEQQASGGTFAEAADRLLAREGEVTSLLQYSPPSYIQWDDQHYRGDAYPCFAWACFIAEVEVDRETFEVTVTNFWSATDVGRAINPTQCRGQIEGGALQAIGWALFEELVWDKGIIKNPRMTNYIVPTALDAPPFHTVLVEEPFSFGPGGGAKGIGELPMDGGAPAVAAAVEHALGIPMDDLPLTPERLFARSASGAQT